MDMNEREEGPFFIRVYSRFFLPNQHFETRGHSTNPDRFQPIFEKRYVQNETTLGIHARSFVNFCSKFRC